MHQLEISNITIDVVRKSIKNMHLSVYPPTGRVRVAAPLNIDDESIKLFAISKLAWIKRHQRDFKKQDRQSPRAFEERESHFYNGIRYLLRVHECNAVPKVVIKNKTHIDLYIRPGSSNELIKTILNEWYRKELKELLPAIIAKWEAIIGVKLEGWGVKQMKTKWGSCNIVSKRIWINLELAKKPARCVEYIVVHEMVHLLERHHNDRFLQYMNQYLPKWKSLKEELNRLPVSHAEWHY